MHACATSFLMVNYADTYTYTVVCVLGGGVTHVKVGQFGVLVGVCVKCWGSACVVRGSFVSIISLG